MFAPSYIAAVVSIVMGAQQLLGLNFSSEEWTGFFVVVAGAVIAARQYLSGKSTAFGLRPRK